NAGTISLYLDPRGREADSYGPGEPGYFALHFDLWQPPSAMGETPPFQMSFRPEATYGPSHRKRLTSNTPWAPLGLQAVVRNHGKLFVIEGAIPFADFHSSRGVIE